MINYIELKLRRMKYITIVIFIFSQSLSSQKIITRANNIIIENKEFHNGSLYLYPSDSKLLAGSDCIYDDNTVEKLFCSFFNTKSGAASPLEETFGSTSLVGAPSNFSL